MSSGRGVFRWRGGQQATVRANIGADVDVQLGDMVVFWLGRVVPLCDVPWNPGKSDDEQRDDVARAFVGVAMQSSPAGHAGTINVAQAGVFQFDCHPLSKVLPRFSTVGPVLQDDAEHWSPCQVAEGWDACVLGRTFRDHAAGATSLCFKLIVRSEALKDANKRTGTTVDTE